jgi:hypothetical protein
MTTYKPPKTKTKKENIPVIHGFKGFDKNMQCRGFQFEEGKTYKHEGEAQACNSGFHFCENPLDVFSYYGPVTSLFHAVECTGQIDKHDDDSKVACTEIKIGPSLTLREFIGAAVKFMFSHKYKETNHATEAGSASSATGSSSASSATGDRSVALATGYSSASSATGDNSVSSTTGYSSASSATGYSSASSATGDRSVALATGYSSASSATGDNSVSSTTGYRSASSATGYSSASSATGDSSESSATGDNSVSSTTGYSSESSATGNASAAVSTGVSSKAMAGKFGCIALVWRNHEERRYEMRCAEIGCGDGSDGKLKAEVWYQLNDSGKFVEAA